MSSSVCQLSNMYGVKTIIALAVLGQFHASAKGMNEVIAFLLSTFNSE